MELSLNVIKEKLDGRFTFGSSRISSEQGFHCVKCYLGQQLLDKNTLYLVDQTRQQHFITVLGETDACSVLTIGWHGENLPQSTQYLSIEGEGELLLMEVQMEVQALFDRFQAWELKLVNLSGRGRPLREFLLLAYEVIENPIMVYDQNYRIVATTKGAHAQPEDKNWNALEDAGYWLPGLRSMVRAEHWHSPKNHAIYHDTNSFDHNSAIVALFDQDCRLGTVFVMEYFSKITPGQLYFIQCFANLLKKELIERNSNDLETLSDMDYFFRMVLFADKDSLTDVFVNRQLAALGWRGSDHYSVLVFEDKFNKQESVYIPEYVHRCFPNSYCLEIKNRLVAVVCLRDDTEEGVTAHLAETLRETVEKCGISNILSGFKNIKYGYSQAITALHFGEMLDPTFWYYRYKDYAVAHMVSYSLQEAPLEVFCHRAILELNKEDQENGTDNVKTLEAYLNGGGNLKKVADGMHMHRNTLQYRLNRIAQTHQINYQNDQEMKWIYLSIKALRLYEALPSAPSNQEKVI